VEKVLKHVPTEFCPTHVITVVPQTAEASDITTWFSSAMMPGIEIFYLPWTKTNEHAKGLNMHLENIRMHIEK